MYNGEKTKIFHISPMTKSGNGFQKVNYYDRDKILETLNNRQIDTIPEMQRFLEFTV